MYKVAIKFADGRRGSIAETFATEDEANEAAVICWLNQLNFDAETEIIKL